MKGKVTIVVRNNKVQFTVELHRKITVICGDSATGKTTLVGLLRSYQEFGPQSGIRLASPKPCVVIGGESWRQQLAMTEDSIVFVDEGNRFLRSKDFADAVKDSDCYFVLITRESLSQLPYSVYAILGMKKTASRSKITYSRTYPLYDRIAGLRCRLDEGYALMTEDSGSGFQLFAHIAKSHDSHCLSAHGKSNIPDVMMAHRGEKWIVIADGAAFGSEIREVLDIINDNEDDAIILYLPESFEWILLMARIIHSNVLDAKLEKPWDYIDSREHTSWETYFFELLQELTKDTVFLYNKDKLPAAFFDSINLQKILDVITGTIPLPDYTK